MHPIINQSSHARLSRRRCISVAVKAMESTRPSPAQSPPKAGADKHSNSIGRKALPSRREQRRSTRVHVRCTRQSLKQSRNHPHPQTWNSITLLKRKITPLFQSNTDSDTRVKTCDGQFSPARTLEDTRTHLAGCPPSGNCSGFSRERQCELICRSCTRPTVFPASSSSW